MSLAVSNYVTRFAVVCSFVAAVLLVPLAVARVVSPLWGAVMLSVLTYFIAKARSVKPVPKILKHLMVAMSVIALSHLVGSLIHPMFQVTDVLPMRRRGWREPLRGDRGD